jgi:hypothetical protein
LNEFENVRRHLLDAQSFEDDGLEGLIKKLDLAILTNDELRSSLVEETKQLFLRTSVCDVEHKRLFLHFFKGEVQDAGHNY